MAEREVEMSDFIVPSVSNKVLLRQIERNQHKARRLVLRYMRQVEREGGDMNLGELVAWLWERMQGN